jgi:hypothetical protein
MLYASVPHGLPSEDSALFTIRYQIAAALVSIGALQGVPLLVRCQWMTGS